MIPYGNMATNIKVNSAFYSYGVSRPKLKTGQPV